MTENIKDPFKEKGIENIERNQANANKQHLANW